MVKNFTEFIFWRNLEVNKLAVVRPTGFWRKMPLNKSLFWICPMLRPAYGGRECPGSSFDYQLCNTEECAGPYEDFRAQQCIQRSNKYHNNVKHTWIPYEHPDGELSSTTRPMSDSGETWLIWPAGFYLFCFLFFSAQRPESVSWAANQRRRERWSSWTRWCTMGRAAATRTLSVCVHVESVWYVSFPFQSIFKASWYVFSGVISGKLKAYSFIIWQMCKTSRLKGLQLWVTKFEAVMWFWLPL